MFTTAVVKFAPAARPVSQRNLSQKCIYMRRCVAVRAEGDEKSPEEINFSAQELGAAAARESSGPQAAETESKQSEQTEQKGGMSAEHKQILEDSKRILAPESLPSDVVEQEKIEPAGLRPIPQAQLNTWTDAEDIRLDEQNKDLDIPREEDLGSRM